MSRRPRNKLPIARELLRPTAYDVTKVRRSLDQEKERQRHYHDTHVKDDLPVFLPGDPVRMAPFPGSTKWQHATVVSRHQSPRSYVVEHNGRKYRRNRRHLRLSTIWADHQKGSQINTERARSTANSRVTRLVAVTPPGQSSQSNARTTGISPNDQRPRPVSPVCQQTPETVVARPGTGRSQEGPPGPSAPTNCPRPPARFVTRSGRVSKPPRRLDL